MAEFVMLLAILTVGFVSQLGDSLDSRAAALVVSYLLTAAAAFLIAPCALRRRSVQRLVWPAMLLGVTAAVTLGEYLGLRDPLRAVWSEQGRLRFLGAFYVPNAAGAAGLVGVILAGAAFTVTRRWFYLAAVPPLCLVMVLADSRGSLLATLAFVAVPAIIAAARWRTARMAMVFCLALLVLLGLGISRSGRIALPDTSHIQPILNRVSTGRWHNWGESLSYLTGPLRWAFGLGLSRNLSFVGRGTYFSVRVRGSNADNFFVDLVGRAGVVGLLLFLGIVTSLAVRLCRGVRQVSRADVSERALGIAVLTATLVLGITNSVILTWGSLHAMVAWPLIAGTATRAASEIGLTRPETHRSRSPTATPT